MENKLQNLKFRVYSEEHSEAIQEKLFSIDKNITWIYSTDQNVEGFDDLPYLILDEDSKIYGADEDWLNRRHSSYKESTLDDLYKMQAEPNPQSELMTKLESLQKELDKVKEEISKLNK